MALVDSLLTAMVRADGDALVMHVGEKPIVIAGARTIDLSSHGMTLGAMLGMIGQLLPTDAQAALQEFGAVEHRLPDREDDRFSVVAARGGDDIWIEIRRRRQTANPVVETPPVEIAAPASEAPAAPADAPGTAASAVATAAVAVADAATETESPIAPVPAGTAETAGVAEVADATETAGEELAAGEVPDEAAIAPLPVAAGEVGASLASAPPAGAAVEGVADVTPEPQSGLDESAQDAPVIAVPAAAVAPELERLAELVADEAAPAVEAAVEPEPFAEPVPVLASAGAAHTVADRPITQVPMDSIPTSGPSSGGGTLPPEAPTAPSLSSGLLPDEPAAQEGPVMRTVRIEVPDRAGSPRALRVNRLLQSAADQGAADLFLLSQARPTVRVDGSIRMLDQEPPLSAADVEALLADITPEPWRDAVGRGDPAEWLVELAAVGRVRCTVFRDQRGPGANFHFLALHPTSMEQLGLGGDARLLASEPDGLVVLAGPGAHERAMLVAAFVDSINRQRGDYIITLEPQVRVLHEARQALLSQREVGLATERVSAAIRAALREEPDVLVIEDVASADAAALAIDASTTGRLVVVSLAEASAAGAVRRLLDLLPSDRREAAAQALSRCLRGALAQMQLRRTSGGRVSAREAWLMTATASRQLAAGDVAALAAGASSSSVFDAFVGYVRSGVVDVREAFRRAPDAERLREALRAAGVDTTPIDRLAG